MNTAGALNVDAPVTLEELLDRNARETLIGCAADLAIALSVITREGNIILGERPPEEVLNANSEYDPLPVVVNGQLWVAAPINHEGARIGTVAVGPYSNGVPQSAATHLAAHLLRVVDAFIHEGTKRALSARMHMATVEEASHELTEKNRRLAQAVERLQEADRIKSNFLATVSHELRTPLTSVIGYSEMLLEGIAGELNDEQREYVRTVMEKGDQLLQLITGILDISRMEASEMRFDTRPIDVEEVISIALSTVAPQALRKKLNMSCELSPDLPPAYGDRDKVRQALLNLLNNAVKFTPDGGKIQISAHLGPIDPRDETKGEGLVVSVRDSGIGIPAEHHQRIFDPFYQVDNSSTREFGGTGLGLNIVRRFVEAQHGKVWVESEEGSGATFRFSLPLVPKSSLPAPANDSPAAP